MIIYNPHSEPFLPQRLRLVDSLLAQVPAKYAFVAGSFLHKPHYQDIDVFVLSRTTKALPALGDRVSVTRLDFNDCHSLFYHSLSKSCVATDLLPTRPLRVTVADYWQVINEAIPALLNHKEGYHKHIRFLVLYTEYLRTKIILDSYGLDARIRAFRSHADILEYVQIHAPAIITAASKPSYVRRYFYTQAGAYRDMRDYPAQDFLYGLTHAIAGAAHG